MNAKVIARGLVAAGVAALAASCGGSEPVGLGSQKLNVVVLVVDSLMPDEISPNGTTVMTAVGPEAVPPTPNLQALKDGGTFYTESRSVYAAETIPNHVAMMTGVYPQRNGIPTNDFIDNYNVTDPGSTRLNIPERLTANTLFTWIDRKCVSSNRNPDFLTGATLSKDYLYAIFAGDAKNALRENDNPNVFNVPPPAEHFWNPASDPAHIGSPDEHTPDAATMGAALGNIGVDFHFINLGDVDRSAHASGPSGRVAALGDTDTQVGRYVSQLVADKRWNNTVLFLVSDHAMDFTAPGPAQAISTQGTLNSLNTACGKLAMKAVPSGQGTEGISVLNRSAPLAQRQDSLRAARACLTDAVACAALCPGTPAPTNASLIEGAWYTADDPVDTAGNMPASTQSKTQNLGDLTVFAKSGGKFNDPNTSANGQIPGNHGMPSTLHNTFIVAGGSPWVKKGVVITASAPATPLDRLPEQSENVDLAPTIAWLLGLDVKPEDFPDYPAQPAGFDGRILKEAFTQFDTDANAPSPSVCGRF